MRRYFTPLGTDCYRVYDKNISTLPITVDMYGSCVYVLDYREGPDDEPANDAVIDTVSRMLYVKKAQIFYKNRKTRKGISQHQKLDNSGNLIEVRENELRFFVNLHDYIDTGLFLDHRKTREMIKDNALGKRVLNLFSYTGSFSVYAAAGGAKAIDTVDLSGSYNRWAEKNFFLNGFFDKEYSFPVFDTAEYLSKARKTGKQYDIIIVDPPTFSNSRKMEGIFDIQRDYVSLLKACLEILAKDGYIIFSTNFSQFHFDPGRFQNIHSKDITNKTIDEDFSRKRKPHRCWTIEKK